MKKSFVLYQDQYEPIKGLTQEQKGCLLDAMFLYQIGEPIPEGDPVVMMAFSFFKQTFERDNDKYLKRCEKNRENVRKRWDTKDTNVYDGIRTDTKHTDSDKIVTVIEDSDSDIKEKEYLPASGHPEVEKTEKQKPANKSMEVMEYPSWLDVEAFEGFLQDRKDRKCPATTKAVKGLVTALDKCCNGRYDLQGQIIEKSICNAWRSFFPLKHDEIPPYQPLEKQLPINRDRSNEYC